MSFSRVWTNRYLLLNLVLVFRAAASILLFFQKSTAKYFWSISRVDFIYHLEYLKCTSTHMIQHSYKMDTRQCFSNEFCRKDSPASISLGMCALALSRETPLNFRSNLKELHASVTDFKVAQSILALESRDKVHRIWVIFLFFHGA